MATGTVKWFNGTKGFGFIQPDGGGPDVFVHISAVERAGMRDLNEGQKISYEVVADRRTGKSSADNLKPGEAREVMSPIVAERRARVLALALAFSRTGDPATGEFQDAVLLARFGE